MVTRDEKTLAGATDELRAAVDAELERGVRWLNDRRTVQWLADQRWFVLLGAPTRLVRRLWRRLWRLDS